MTPPRAHLIPLGVLIAILSLHQARAADKAPPEHYNTKRLSCVFIKTAIKIAGGLDTAIGLATANGYTQVEIADAVERCKLK